MSLADRVGKIDKKMIFFLALIFLIGFGFRGHLLKYELFFEFDSYWHARMTEQIITNGSPFLTDPMSYYQIGGGPMSYTGVGWWYITAAFYKVFSLPFTLGAYDKLLWIQFVKFLPAFFGALTGIAMFFLFRVLYGTRAGYLAGFFTAISSGYIYRTMAGFFEGGAILFLLMAIGFYFAARALKELKFDRGIAISAILSGVFLGLTGFLGGWYLLVSYIFVPFFVLGTLILWFRNQNVINFLKVCAIILVIFAAFNFFFGLDFFVQGYIDKDYKQINPLMHVHGPFAWFEEMWSYFQPYIGLGPPKPSAEAAEGDIGTVFTSSVGEQQEGLSSFGNKFNALLVFPVIALFLIPWRIWKKKDDSVSLLLFFWVAATFAMAILRLQMTFAFGLGLAVAAAFVTNEILDFAQKRSSFEKGVLCLGLVLFVFIGVAQAALFTNDQVPNIESDAGWKDALAWIKANTPADAKMFNWWDEGHWISFIGERKVLLDNRNIDLNGDSDVARAIVTDDVNEACRIIRGYGSDYAILGADLLGKQGSMAQYAYKSINWSNPKMQEFVWGSSATGQLQLYYGTAVPCNKTADGKYDCGLIDQSGQPLLLDDASMKQISSKWSTQPFRLADDSRTPVFLYREENNTMTYWIYGARINNSFIARAWFGDPSVYCLKHVYGDRVKVFKVI